MCQVQTHAPQQIALFDHLVGAEQKGLRDRQAEPFRRLEIDDQLNLRRLLDEKSGGSGTPEDMALALTALQPGLKNHVEGGLSSSSHLGEATFGDDFAQFGFPSLCPESGTNFLRKRCR